MTHLDQELPSPQDLHQLAQLCAQLRAAEIEQLEAEAVLEQKTAEVRRLAEHEIPLLMAECGVEDFGIGNGTRVSVKKICSATLPEDTRDEAFEWLTKNEHGGMIKHAVTVKFSREQEEKALALAEQLGEIYENVQNAGKIEPSTLSAWVRRQIEQGNSFPRHLFKVTELRRAKITQQ